MYEIASSVMACLRAGTGVDVAWAVETDGFGSRDRGEALAITPGGARVGSVLAGSIDDQLADLVNGKVTRRLVALHVSEDDALEAGLSCGGNARCLLVPAADLPAELWERLGHRQPVCLVTRLDGDRVAGTAIFTRDTIAEAGEDVARSFARGISDTTLHDEAAVTVLWPVPTLVIVGAGAIADALAASVGLLGWHSRAVTEAGTVSAVIAELATLDNVVVISHDHELAGPALTAALAGEVGYIGALGSRRTQQARADWLASRGINDLDRIHGPAGLDVGANAPAEIAVSIIAEALAVRSGSSSRSLRELTGPIMSRSVPRA